MNGQLELELGAQSNESNKYKKVSDLDMYQQVAKQTAIYPSCLLYTSPSPRDDGVSRMPSSA